MAEGIVKRLLERRKALDEGDVTGAYESRNADAIREELGSSKEISEKEHEKRKTAPK